MAANRVAAVTGGNKGIGFAIVRALCKQFDGDVYLTSRSEERGQSAVKELEAEGLKPKFHVLDITEQKSVDAFAEFLVKNYGGADVFVHNAAIAYKAADLTPFSEQATVTIAANYTSTVYLCNAILPIMKDESRISILASQAGTGSLKRCSGEVQAFFKSPEMTEEALTSKMKDFVNAAQTGCHGEKGFANSAYGMSKLGVIAFTRLLGEKAKRLNKKNVLVNCCCPGYVDTDMTSHKGPLTTDQGAITPTFLAMIQKGAQEPNGEFLYEKKVVKWY